MTFIAKMEIPRFQLFVTKHREDFQSWHDARHSHEKLEKIWSQRFAKGANYMQKKVKVFHCKYLYALL